MNLPKRDNIATFVFKINRSNSNVKSGTHSLVWFLDG